MSHLMQTAAAVSIISRMAVRSGQLTPHVHGCSSIITRPQINDINQMRRWIHISERSKTIQRINTHTTTNISAASTRPHLATSSRPSFVHPSRLCPHHSLSYYQTTRWIHTARTNFQLANSHPIDLIRTLTVNELINQLEANQLQLPMPSASNNQTAESPPIAPQPIKLRVRGWIRSIRGSKATSFLLLNDGTRLFSLQCVIDHNIMKRDVPEGQTLSTGASVEIEGELVWVYKAIQNMTKQLNEGATSESLSLAATLPLALATTASTPMPQLPLVEIQASSIRLIGASDPTTYPMAKTALPLEHLREFLHLRTRTTTMSAVMRIRSRAQMGIHQFFLDEGFFNVHTPILTPLDCEGAGEVFNVTSSLDKPDQPFFGRPTYLTVSGQLYAEMLACSLSRVYTFGPTFRAENSQTVRHLNEFWMVEPEMAYANLDTIIQLSEKFVKFMVQYLLRHCDSDLRFCQTRFNPALLPTLENVLKQPFARITYTEALDILQASKQKWTFEPTWTNGLQSEHEKYLADIKFKRPVFITNYPRAAKPFYMKTDQASLATPGRETVACFDLIIPGVGELIGGSEREERYEQLLANMVEHKLDPKLYSWYLDLRTFGTVPHAGFGLGFERLLRYVTSMANIRDLILVPRTPGPAGGQF